MAFRTRNKTGSIYRYQTTGSKKEYSDTPTYTKVDAGVFPASPQIATAYPGVPAYQLYEFFFDDYVTLQRGDKYIDENTGESWIIRAEPMTYSSARSFYLHAIGEKVIGQ